MFQITFPIAKLAMCYMCYGLLKASININHFSYGLCYEYLYNK